MYSLDEEAHAKHLKMVVQILWKEWLYAKYSKCKFWMTQVAFLGHVLTREGIQVDSKKVEALLN